MFQEFARIFIYLGVILIIIGGVLWFSGRFPFIGKLPGDILIKRGNFTLYAPIATSILVSLIITLLLTIFSNLKR